MKSLFVSAIFVATLNFAGSLFAELPAESVELNARYEEDRTRGLILLNKRYIEAFEAQMTEATKAGNIDGAIEIKAKIDELEAENSRLGGGATQPEMVKEEPTEEEALDLKGKTVWFPHDTSPDNIVGFKFLGDGEAIWIGLGGLEVDRAYEAMDEPRKFHVWWPERPSDKGYEITVSEDGKTATVRNVAKDLFADGEVKRTR